MNWLEASLKELERYYQTNFENGLSEKQVQQKVRTYGENIVQKHVIRSLWRLLLEQCQHPMLYFLFGGAIIIALSGDYFDALITFIILLVNVSIGSFQEYKIDRVIRHLSAVEKTHVSVMRDGKKHVISVCDLVPGDIVFIQEGEKIPADARVLDSYSMSVDESTFTGESYPIVKYTPIDDHVVTDEYRVYAGSLVVSGQGRLLITQIGAATRLGSLHTMVESIETVMPIQSDLARLLRSMLFGIAGLCSVFFFIGIIAGKPFGQLLATVIALFMCVVPQGLPVVMTFILVSAAYGLSKNYRLLTKKLQAIETLGRVDVIVFDKTGTITRNETMISALVTGEKTYVVTGDGYHAEGAVFDGDRQLDNHSCPDDVRDMMQAALLINDAEITYNQEKERFFVRGNASEAAMVLCAKKLGFSKEQCKAKSQELYKIPFDVHNQYHAGFYTVEEKGVVFAIGSPDVLIKRCSFVSKEKQAELVNLVSQGLRIIAVTKKEFDIQALRHQLKSVSMKEQEAVWHSIMSDSLTFVGVYVLSDTMRKDAHSVIKKLKDSGIAVMMATGDNVQTAQTFAQKAGVFKEGDSVAEGALLSSLSSSQLASKMKAISVWGRMTPADKWSLVSSLQQEGHVVAMVGDGVNDAPALKAAHVGLVMGKHGSESAKEAAHLIVQGDSFSSIVAGIVQGRHVFDSFKRVITYFFTSNAAEIVVMLCAFIFSNELPLLAPHILWLNIVTDGFLDSALAFEPYNHTLSRLRSKKSLQLMSKGLVIRVLYQACLVAGGAFAAFYYMHLHTSLEKAQTLTLVFMTLGQWAVAFNCRSSTRSLFSIGLFSNRWLAFILTIIPVCLVGITIIPGVMLFFKTVSLSGLEWAVAFGWALFIIVVEELRKLFVRTMSTAIDE